MRRIRQLGPHPTLIAKVRLTPSDQHQVRMVDVSGNVASHGNQAPVGIEDLQQADDGEMVRAGAAVRAQCLRQLKLVAVAHALLFTSSYHEGGAVWQERLERN